MSTVESYECDNCGGACDTPHGDPDRTTVCCVCAFEAYPVGVPELCGPCEARTTSGY